LDADRLPGRLPQPPDPARLQRAFATAVAARDAAFA
jgi:hypothetical protein